MSWNSIVPALTAETSLSRCRSIPASQTGHFVLYQMVSAGRVMIWLSTIRSQEELAVGWPPAYQTMLCENLIRTSSKIDSLLRSLALLAEWVPGAMLSSAQAWRRTPRLIPSALGNDRGSIEVMRFGSATRAFHAAQHAPTMSVSPRFSSSAFAPRKTNPTRWQSANLAGYGFATLCLDSAFP